MNTAELKARAEKATPGPWHRMANKDFGPISESDDQSFGMFIDCGSAHSDEDAYFIAAANPAAILELIAQLEDAQGEIRALRDRVKELERQLTSIVTADDDHCLSQNHIELARALLEKTNEQD